jgi:2-C-methyl-D-erythritol 4-phosphate cytidylyltransferase
VTASSRQLSTIVPLPISVAVDPSAAFYPVAGQAPLLRIVRTLLGAVPDPTCVVVAAAERLVADARQLLAEADMASVGVAPVGGPATRAQCLTVGLEHVARQTFSSRHVLIHDIRQPLVSANVRDRVIAHLVGGDPVVLPVVPVTDSVKAVDEHGAVTATLDRSTLQVVQYPRGFAVDHLARLLASFSEAEFDEADAAIRARAPITTVDGDAEASIVELPRDAGFLEAVIASRPR